MTLSPVKSCSGTSDDQLGGITKHVERGLLLLAFSATLTSVGKCWPYPALERFVRVGGNEALG